MEDHHTFRPIELMPDDLGIVSGGEESGIQDEAPMSMDAESVASSNDEEKNSSRTCSCRRRSMAASASEEPKRTYVKHNYHDHFFDPMYRNGCDEVAEGPGGKTSRAPRRGPRGGVVIPFPEKLYHMLNQVEQDGLEDVVSWQPHGRCFVVHDPKRMVEEVLPRYFRQSKLTSFQRQVNLYGFQRLTQGKDRGGYYHELFLRGRPDLHKRLVRIRVKGTGFKSAASPSTEPDFYTMHFCAENPESINVATSTELDALDALQSSALPPFKPLASPGPFPFVDESHHPMDDNLSLRSLVSSRGLVMSTLMQSDYMNSAVNDICPVTPDESESSNSLRRLSLPPAMMELDMPSLPVLKGDNEGDFSPLPLMSMVMADVKKLLKEEIQDFPWTNPLADDANVPLSVQQQHHILLRDDPKFSAVVDDSCDPLLLLDEVVMSAYISKHSRAYRA